jgi:outer membrane protein assembly factor BamB
MREKVRAVAVLIGFVVLFGCSTLRLTQDAPLTPDDWPQLGGNAERTNAITTEIKAPLKILWESDISASTSAASPVTSNGLIFIATQNGDLTCLASETGKELGSSSIGNGFASSPVVENDLAMVFDSFSATSLVGFDLRRGTERYEKKIGIGFEASPLVVGTGFSKKIYNGNLNGDFFCFTPAGSQVFVYKTTEVASNRPARKQIHASPALCNNVVVFGNDAGVLYGITADGGSPVFKLQLDGTLYATPAVSGKTIYIGTAKVGTSVGNFYAVDLSDATHPKIKFTMPVTGAIYGSAAVSDSLVLIGSSNRTLYALRKNDFSEAWHFTAKAPINTAPLITGATVHVASLDARLYSLELATGKCLGSLHLSGRLKTPPIAYKDKLIVCADDRTVFALIHTDKPDTTTVEKEIDE